MHYACKLRLIYPFNLIVVFGINDIIQFPLVEILYQLNFY